MRDTRACCTYDQICPFEAVFQIRSILLLLRHTTSAPARGLDECGRGLWQSHVTSVQLALVPKL